MLSPNLCVIGRARLFGDSGQAVLREARVGIIGLGGVGILLAEYLGRLGVGHFVRIDPERVAPSNLPRLPGATRSWHTRTPSRDGTRALGSRRCPIGQQPAFTFDRNMHREPLHLLFESLVLLGLPLLLPLVLLRERAQGVGQASTAHRVAATDPHHEHTQSVVLDAGDNAVIAYPVLPKLA